MIKPIKKLYSIFGNRNRKSSFIFNTCSFCQTYGTYSLVFSIIVILLDHPERHPLTGRMQWQLTVEAATCWYSDGHRPYKAKVPLNMDIEYKLVDKVDNEDFVT